MSQNIYDVVDYTVESKSAIADAVKFPLLYNLLSEDGTECLKYVGNSLGGNYTPDELGIYRQRLVNEPGFVGARREVNLALTCSEDTYADAGGANFFWDTVNFVGLGFNIANASQYYKTSVVRDYAVGDVIVCSARLCAYSGTRTTCVRVCVGNSFNNVSNSAYINTTAGSPTRVTVAVTIDTAVTNATIYFGITNQASLGASLTTTTGSVYIGFTEVQFEVRTGKTNPTVASDYMSVGIADDWNTPELVLNNKFDLGSSYWVPTTGTTITDNGNSLTVTNTSAGATRGIFQYIPVVAGKTYVVSLYARGNVGSLPAILLGSGPASASYLTLQLGALITIPYRMFATFVPTVDQVCMTLACGSGIGDNSLFFEVSIKEAVYYGSGVPQVKHFNTNQDGTPINLNILRGYYSTTAQSNLLSSGEIRGCSVGTWILGATMTRANTIGADGSTSLGTRLTGGATPATNTVLKTFTLASAQRTYSAVVRRVTGTGPIYLSHSGTELDISADLTSTYKDFQITVTSANPSIGIRIENNGDQVDVDFNLCIVDTNALGTTPTRNWNLNITVDVISTPAFRQNGPSTSVGTVLIDADLVTATPVTAIIGATSTILGTDSGNLTCSDGTNVATIAASLPGIMQTLAATWGTTKTIYQDGIESSIGSTFDGSMNYNGILYIGSNASSLAQPNCRLNNLIFDNTRMDNRLLELVTGG